MFMEMLALLALAASVSAWIPGDTNPNDAEIGTDVFVPMPDPDPALLADSTYGHRYAKAVAEARKKGEDPLWVHAALHRAWRTRGGVG